jgi:hypothetical protein
MGKGFILVHPEVMQALEYLLPRTVRIVGRSVRESDGVNRLEIEGEAIDDGEQYIATVTDTPLSRALELSRGQQD